MLTFEAADAYLRRYYPDQYAIVGPDEVEHIIEDGEYGTTEGAQFFDAWTALSHVSVVLAILRHCYALASEGIEKYRRKTASQETPVVDEKVVATIRTHVIEVMSKKYGVTIEPSDPLLSEEAIQRAFSSTVEEKK